MAHMLVMAAIQLRHPMFFFVQMETDYFSFHKIREASY